MKIRNLLLPIISLATLQGYADLVATGSNYTTITPSKTTGLEAVVIVEDLASSRLVYNASSPEAAKSVRWKRFGSAGGGYAEDVVEFSVTGSDSAIKPNAGDAGYIVEDGGRQFAWWVVDYSRHQPTMTAFEVSADSDCDRVVFNATGGFDRINYYSVNGAPVELDRGITLEYSDLEMSTSTNDDDSGVWQLYTKKVDFADITGIFSTIAPLCDTEFHLTGDRFAKMWGNPVNLNTSTYKTKRVEARTWAIQAERDNNNEQNNSTSGLGGSAPCDITFKAVATDAAVFREWQFSATEDFADVMYRFNEDEFTYTFTEYGNIYARFVCADASGECTYEGDVYTIMIGESKLLCPNAFSPQNEDGVNDEWKVSYASLISYDCHIFNRWGKQLFSSTNPAEGWDGRVGGKFVPAGVYFYVIKAEGADGVKYNLSGDINIVGSKLRPATATEE